MQWVDKFRRELVELQVDDDQAAQLPVEDEEVHPVPFVSNPQAALVSDKGEVAPQLQQEAQKEHNGTREA